MAHHRLGLRAVLDMRNDDALRAAVEDSAHPMRLVARHPHQRGDADAECGGADRRGSLDRIGRMLHIDVQRVIAAGFGDHRDVDACAPDANSCTAPARRPRASASSRLRQQCLRPSASSAAPHPGALPACGARQQCIREFHSTPRERGRLGPVASATGARSGGSLFIRRRRRRRRARLRAADVSCQLRPPSWVPNTWPKRDTP